MWLGGFRRFGSVFGWKDGSNWNYENWASNEPNNVNGAEDYLEFYGDWKTGEWNDQKGNNQLSFVCQKHVKSL